MATATNGELVNASRSHWLAFPTDRRPTADLPFEKEEVHPVIAFDVTRAGRVRCEFHADRYVASVWNKEDDSSTLAMGSWRIWLGDVRVDDPENQWTSEHAKGIGDAARKAIREAGEPMIHAWLESASYRSSRRKTAAHAYRRELKDAAGRGAYALERARQYLQACASELAPLELSTLKQATEQIAGALELLDRDPIG